MQRSEVGGGETRVGGDSGECSGYQHGPGRLPLLHVVEELPGVESPLDERGRPTQQSREGLDVQPADVEQRDRGEHPVAAREVMGVG